MGDATHSPVFYAKSDDPGMAKAVANAVASFKYLWRELTWEYRRIVPALELSAIKAAFNDPGGTLDTAEHMWLSNIEFDGETISATLMNSPNGLKSIAEGDGVKLRVDQLEDWMYVVGGHVYGGFTIQVLRAGMSPAERRSHDEAWGFDFAEPDRVDLVPDWQAAKGKAGVPTSSDPDAEHPMSESMASGFASVLEDNKESFFELGPDGLNALHSLALGGSSACVKVLLAAGADPSVKTSKGKTARELAQSMGWPRVVALLKNAEA